MVPLSFHVNTTLWQLKLQKSVKYLMTEGLQRWNCIVLIDAVQHKWKCWQESQENYWNQCLYVRAKRLLNHNQQNHISKPKCQSMIRLDSKDVCQHDNFTRSDYLHCSSKYSIPQTYQWHFFTKLYPEHFHWKFQSCQMIQGDESGSKASTTSRDSSTPTLGHNYSITSLKSSLWKWLEKFGTGRKGMKLHDLLHLHLCSGN